MLIDGILMALTDHSPPEALCVLRALGLGDLLTALPALRGLRNHFADAQIVLTAPRGLRELAMLSGAVDEVAHQPARGYCRLERVPTLAVKLARLRSAKHRARAGTASRSSALLRTR